MKSFVIQSENYYDEPIMQFHGTEDYKEQKIKVKVKKNEKEYPLYNNIMTNYQYNLNNKKK